MGRLAIQGGEKTVRGSWPRWPQWDETEVQQLREVMESPVWGGTGLGPKVKELNETFARYCDARYGVAVANGTVSMELALRGLGIRPGDEVIVPAYTFMATAIVVIQVGATPVFVDIDPETLGLDPGRTEAAISERTRAMIPVHLGGHPADMGALVDLAQQHGLKIVEDAAQAHGAIWRDAAGRTRKLGALGEAGSYSFQQSKNMQCGEGGMVVTDDGDLADRIHYRLGKFGRGIRDQYAPHVHYHFGFNACITELQAALALAQFDRLEEQTRIRAENGRFLIGVLDGVEGITPLRWQAHCVRHGYHLFLFRYDRSAFGGVSKDRFIEALSAEGAPCAGIYPVPLYEQPMYDLERKVVRDTGTPIRVTSCPEAARACREIVCFEQKMLLAERDLLQEIPTAIEKIRANVDALR